MVGIFDVDVEITRRLVVVMTRRHQHSRPPSRRIILLQLPLRVVLLSSLRGVVCPPPPPRKNRRRNAAAAAKTTTTTHHRYLFEVGFHCFCPKNLSLSRSLMRNKHTIRLSSLARDERAISRPKHEYREFRFIIRNGREDRERERDERIA